MEVTQWFDPQVDGQPARIGWYQRDWQIHEAPDQLDYWDGKYWMAYGPQSTPSFIQFKRWRGLTSPAETTFKQGDKFTMEGFKGVFTVGKIIAGK
jgi:hypothetical protein